MEKQFQSLVIRLLLLIANKVILGSRGTTPKQQELLDEAAEYLRPKGNRRPSPRNTIL